MYKVSLRGENQTVFAPTAFVGAPYSLAIDWVGRNLYWGDIIASTIQVVNMDGHNHYHKILLTNTGNDNGLAKPVAMCVDPAKG